MDAATRPARRPKRILVVDDEADIRVLIADILEAAGHDVETAADGDEALFLLEQVQPDLILLDLMMPKVDGREVIEAIRANSANRHLPIVVVSAQFGLMRKCSHGVQRYLPKPWDTDVLLETIEQELRQQPN